MVLTPRAARADDYAFFARLFPELGVPDPVPSAADFTNKMLPHVLVVEDGHQAVGYAFWLPYGGTAHVINVVVDRAARGRRVGASLLDAVRSDARAKGCSRWYLNVKQDNQAAKRLYERCGFSVEFESWTTTGSWSRMRALPPRAAASRTFTPGPADDVPLASALGLDPERLAILRAHGSALAAVADGESGEPLGFAAFDSKLPGVYPIRASSVGAAAALFRALEPHATEDRVVVMVEGDGALHEALVAVGAHTDFALYRMSGALPGAPPSRTR
jgi:GNAT superfamily N-acetyltransferase